MTAEEGQGETILVVEDAEALRGAIKAGLESLGYRAITAADGRRAMEVVTLERVDLVLTDVVMPDAGGRGLLREVRARGADVPVVAMTGYTMDAETEALRDAGFSEILPKPFSAEDLARVVRDALEAHGTWTVRRGAM